MLLVAQPPGKGHQPKKLMWLSHVRANEKEKALRATLHTASYNWNIDMHIRRSPYSLKIDANTSGKEVEKKQKGNET